MFVGLEPTATTFRLSEGGPATLRKPIGQADSHQRVPNTMHSRALNEGKSTVLARCCPELARVANRAVTPCQGRTWTAASRRQTTSILESTVELLLDVLVPSGMESSRNTATSATIGSTRTTPAAPRDHKPSLGSLSSPVSSFVSHPLAVPGGFVGTEVDLAIVFWDNPLPFTPRSIGSAVLNEVLTYSGFGRPATPAGFLPVTGDRRAFETYVDAFGAPIAGISSDYINGIFRSPGVGSLPLGGVGTGGNSGSGVFNQAGSIVAITAAQAGAPGYLASTYSLRLDLYQPWINSVVPTPGTASLLLLGGIFAARRRRG